jgi:molybdopterin converting factor small subunit
MKIKVLFFGATADAAGKREMMFKTSASDAGSALSEIVGTMPSLATHKLLFAVNEAYVDRSAILNEGDELAIFTAVSGG